MAKKNDEKGINVNEAPEEATNDITELTNASDNTDVEDLRKQLKESNNLLTKALEALSNLTGGTKYNPDAEVEKADRGVIDWKPSANKDDYLNERVPFRAFKDNDKYKDDIVVGINGYNYVIKRGVTVMIPRFVLHAIENAERQAGSAIDYSQWLTDHFSKRTQELLGNQD